MPIYFVFDFKTGDMAAIFVFDPPPQDNIVLADISKIVQGRGLVTIIYI